VDEEARLEPGLEHRLDVGLSLRLSTLDCRRLPRMEREAG